MGKSKKTSDRCHCASKMTWMDGVRPSISPTSTHFHSHDFCCAINDMFIIHNHNPYCSELDVGTSHNPMKQLVSEWRHVTTYLMWSLMCYYYCSHQHLGTKQFLLHLEVSADACHESAKLTVEVKQEMICCDTPQFPCLASSYVITEYIEDNFRFPHDHDLKVMAMWILPNLSHSSNLQSSNEERMDMWWNGESTGIVLSIDWNIYPSVCLSIFLSQLVIYHF